MRRLTPDERVAFWRGFAGWCAVSAFLAVLAVGVAVAAVLRGRPADGAAGLTLPPPADAATSARLVQQLEVIEAAVDVFQTRHGRLPAALDDVVRDGLLPQRALVAAGTDTAFLYTVTQNGHVISAPLRTARPTAATAPASAELDAPPAD